MRVGVIADVHANKVALDAVLSDMDEVAAVVCAGDVVGYNPWPGECIEQLRSLDVPTVMGNHDRMVVAGRNFVGNSMASAGVALARNVLTDSQRDWLSSLPIDRYACDDRIKIVHGHPDDPNHYTYPEEFSPDLLGNEEVLVMGHTHLQSHTVFPDGIVLNPGSVGQPRDGDPRAAYSVVDLAAHAVHEHRVPYDIPSVREAISDAQLPRETGERLVRGR